MRDKVATKGGFHSFRLIAGFIGHQPGTQGLIDMENNRRAVRFRSLKAGLLFINDGRSTFNCIIRNISETGAKLTLEQVVPLPDRFVLRFSDGTRRDCRIRWRKSMDIGVSFEDQGAPPSAASSANPQIV